MYLEVWTNERTKMTFIDIRRDDNHNEVELYRASEEELPSIEYHVDRLSRFFDCPVIYK